MANKDDKKASLEKSMKEILLLSKAGKGYDALQELRRVFSSGFGPKEIRNALDKILEKAYEKEQAPENKQNITMKKNP